MASSAPDDYVDEVVDASVPMGAAWHERFRAEVSERATLAARRIRRAAGRALPTAGQRLKSRVGLTFALSMVALIALRTWHWSGALAPRAADALNQWGVPEFIVSAGSLVSAVLVVLLATVLWPEHPEDESPSWFLAGCLVVWVWSGSFLILPLAALGLAWLIRNGARRFYQRFLEPEDALLRRLLLGAWYLIVGSIAAGFTLSVGYLLWRWLW